MATSMLILDTPDGDLEQLTETFRAAAGSDFHVEVVTSSQTLLRRLGSGLPCDLVVLDYLVGDGTRSGSDVVRSLRRRHAEVPVIAVAEHGNVELAAEAVRAGVTDFLVRGGQLQERVATLMQKVRTLLELIHRNRLLREQNLLLRQGNLERYRIVGESPQTIAMLQQIERVARIPRPVLILGERGTGKELVARAIHTASERPDRPFVVVNCAAFPDTLLESELFGHERGSFTGADSAAHGKFEQADGGSLFLDEIGNMSLSFQQKILRIVEYGTFTRVGGTGEIQTNARILAATNADLQEAIRRGDFLQDLYDRLAFEVVAVPPLRQREGDVEILARHFLNEFMREIPALGGKRLSQTAIDVLRRYPFPGNVRELKNIIERAAYRDTTNEITPEDIGMLPDTRVAVTGGNFDQRVETFKRQLVLAALEQAGGNQAQAARDLGQSYHQFRYYYQKYAATPQT